VSTTERESKRVPSEESRLCDVKLVSRKLPSDGSHLQGREQFPLPRPCQFYAGISGRTCAMGLALRQMLREALERLSFDLEGTPVGTLAAGLRVGQSQAYVPLPALEATAHSPGAANSS
jgi:hypothetical protein